jgi:23S rRNA pseudouridine2605 synthase
LAGSGDNTNVLYILFKRYKIKMRKSSSNSSRDARPGSKSTFKKDHGTGSFNDDRKPPFKKNNSGGPSSSADGRPPRKAKPYSGRVAGDDKPFRAANARPFNDDRKPSFKNDDSGGSFSSGSDRPARKAKPYSGRAVGSGEDKPFRSSGPRSSGNEGRPAFNRDGPPSSSSGDGRPPRKAKPYSGRSADSGSFRPDSKPFRKDGENQGPPRKKFDKPREDNHRIPFNERPKRTYDKPGFTKEEGRGGDDKPRRDFDKPRKSGGDSRPFRDRPKEGTDGRKKPFKKDGFAGKAGKSDDGPRSFKDVMDNAFNQPKSKKKEPSKEDIVVRPQEFEDQVFGEIEDVPATEVPKRPFEKKPLTERGKKKRIHDHSEGRKKKNKDDEDDDDDQDEEDKEINQKDGPRLEMPLNKFIAHSGECSRRDAAELVRQGKVKVNEELVLDPGYRVQHDDKVTMSGKKLTPQKGMVYILLNKPKGFITTNDDPQGRKTVMQLVGNAGVDRLFPVGRLDRDTSGLLLITNDGDLTQKLCHPSYAIKKVYQVTLDKHVTHADFEKIVAGVDLEDGIAKVDAMAYLENKNEIGLEIHSGRNRIVRRIFESLGYIVEKLDRVMYAGLTKKNLPRSKWRYLEPREVVLLKHFKS